MCEYLVINKKEMVMSRQRVIKDIFWVVCESLKRHPDYKDDYERYMELEANLDSFSDPREDHFKIEYDEIKNELNKLHKKYKISLLVDVDDPRAVDILRRRHVAVLKESKGMIDYIPFSGTQCQEPVVFKVDIYRKMSQIKKEMEDRINEVRKAKKIKERDERAVVSHFVHYFKVYDMFKENSWSPRNVKHVDNVAKKYHKGLFERGDVCSLNDARKSVRRDYKRCEDLIFRRRGQIV